MEILAPDMKTDDMVNAFPSLIFTFLFFILENFYFNFNFVGEAIDAEHKDIEVDLSKLGAVNTMLAALFW